MALNKVLLIGNVGQDPEIRNLQGGAKVANFSLATTERWKDRDGEQQESTEWHRIVAWDKKADLVESYVRKGMQVYIEGKIATRQWTDQEGRKNYSTEIQVVNIQLLGAKAESNQGREAEVRVSRSKSAKPESLDPTDHPEDLPF